MNKNKYVADPPLALAVLQKLAEEIPSGVSAADVGHYIPQLCDCEELTTSVNQRIVDELTAKLNHTWREEDIEKKLLKIQQLKTIPSNEIKPIPNATDQLRSLQYKHLQDRKKQLLEKITKVQQDNLQLKNEVLQNAEMIKKQSKDIEDFKFNREKC